MNDDGIPDPRTQRRKDPTGEKRAAWKQTLEDQEAVAEDRRDDGWDVLTIVAAHTDTVSIDMGEHDDFGLFHIIPNNHAEEFTGWWDPDEFTEFLVYGNDVQGFMYAVIEFIDPDTERTILLACRYDMTRAQGLVASAEKEGVLYSRIKLVDGTVLAEFEYENYEPLVRNPSAQ